MFKPHDEAWWDAWWAADFSWTGLADKFVGQNKGKIHGGLRGEKSLQDYWRRDPTTNAVRDEAALRASGELVECEGIEFHVAHLPPRSQADTLTWKKDLNHPNWTQLEALVAERIAAAAETNTDVFGGAEGPDGRAQLAGAILRSAIGHHQDNSKLHLEATRSAWLGQVDFTSAFFGAGANFVSAAFARDAIFTDVTFSGSANFTDADFAGVANFSGSGFVGDVEFRDATFCQQAQFQSANFSGNAHFNGSSFIGQLLFWSAVFEKDAWFRRCQFAGIVWLDGTVFRGDMDFTAATFERSASLERIAWPADGRYWHAAFDQVQFRGAMALTGAGLRCFAAFDGATLERGVQVDDESESKAREAFKSDRAAAVAAASADGKSWGREENERRKRVDEKMVDRRELRARVRVAREERLKQLERGCRVLKQAMERASNKSREQMLYRFELQARRAQRDLPPGEALFSDLYAVASDYGASMVRPFFALAALLVIFTVVFWGFAIALDPFVPARLLADPWPAQLWSALDFSWDNVFKPLSALASDPPKKNGSMMWLLLTECGPGFAFGVRLLATVQSLFAIVLAFLFALAVRRRFQIS